MPPQLPDEANLQRVLDVWRGLGFTVPQEPMVPAPGTIDASMGQPPLPATPLPTVASWMTPQAVAPPPALPARPSLVDTVRALGLDDPQVLISHARGQTLGQRLAAMQPPRTWSLPTDLPAYHFAGGLSPVPLPGVDPTSRPYKLGEALSWLQAISPALAASAPPALVHRLLRINPLQERFGPFGLVGVPNPLEGPMSGPAFDAIAARFPGTAEVWQALGGVLPEAIGSRTLHTTIVPTDVAGQYRLTPEAQARIASFYEIGANAPRLSTWGGVRDELLAAFGGDEQLAELWARLWGATSPHTSVPVNTKESIAMFLHAIQRGRIPIRMTTLQKQGLFKVTQAGSKVKNINRALLDLGFDSPKAEAMAEFMAMNPRLPIDVHALAGLGMDVANADFRTEVPGLRALMTRAESLPHSGGLTDWDIYRRYEQALRDTLQAIDPNTNLNLLFARYWEGVRMAKRAARGLPWKFEPAAIDILRQTRLGEAGAMLDPNRLMAVLKANRWSVPAIFGLLSALHEYVPPPPETADEEGARMPHGLVSPGQAVTAGSR